MQWGTLLSSQKHQVFQSQGRNLVLFLTHTVYVPYCFEVENPATPPKLHATKFILPDAAARTQPKRAGEHWHGCKSKQNLAGRAPAPSSPPSVQLCGSAALWLLQRPSPLPPPTLVPSPSAPSVGTDLAAKHGWVQGSSPSWGKRIRKM